MSSTTVKLLAAVLALGAGVAAVVVAYLLLHGTPGPS
jgi:phage shock protein PspC (stress-responsive transcriptional regulator)